MKVPWFNFSLGVILILYAVVAIVSKWTPLYGGWIVLIAATFLTVISGIPIWNGFFRWIKPRPKH